MTPTAGEESGLGGSPKGSSPLEWQHMMKKAAQDNSPPPTTPPPSPATTDVAGERASDEKLFRVRGFKSIEVTSKGSATRSVAASHGTKWIAIPRSDSIRSGSSSASSRRSARSSASSASRGRASAGSKTKDSLNNGNSGVLSALKSPQPGIALGTSNGKKKQVTFRPGSRRSTSSRKPKPKGTPAQRPSRTSSASSSVSSKVRTRSANAPAQRAGQTSPSPPSSSSKPSRSGRQRDNLATRLPRSVSMPSKPEEWYGDVSSKPERHGDTSPRPPPPYKPRKSSSMPTMTARRLAIPAPAQRPNQGASPSSPASVPSTSRVTKCDVDANAEETSSPVKKRVSYVIAVDEGGGTGDHLREESPPSPSESYLTSEDNRSMVVSMGVPDSTRGRPSSRTVAPSPFSYGFKGMFVEGKESPSAQPAPEGLRAGGSEVMNHHESEVERRHEKPSTDSADFRSLTWRESPKEEVITMCPNCLRVIERGSTGGNSEASNSNNSNSRSGYRKGGQYSSDEDAL